MWATPPSAWSRRIVAAGLLVAAVIVVNSCKIDCNNGYEPDPQAAADTVSGGWHDLIDGTRALDEVARFVALGLRDSGTEGAERAADYLRARLSEFGVAAEIDAFEDRSPKGRIVFRNVIGRIPGTREGLIVVGSHYDTKSGMGPGFEGANDSGSSTGLLLEIGRLLQARAPLPGPAVELAFFDGEECMVAYGPNDGLHGSRRMAQRLRETGRADTVRAVIVIDMIGDRDLRITVPRNSTPALRQLALRAAAEVNARQRIGLMPHGMLDDHAPFLKAGMPAVLLIDFEYGSAPGRNDYWHTLDDSMDKLSADSLAVTGRIVLRMLEILMASP